MKCVMKECNAGLCCVNTGCGREIPNLPGEIIAKCRSADVPKSPPVVGMVLSYIASQVKQVWSGEKVTEKERLERLALCTSCPKYAGYCTLCGCAANAGASHLTNKLALSSPDWPVLTDAEGKTIFECPQLGRERSISAEGVVPKQEGQ